MTTPFITKRGDLLPLLIATLSDVNGPVDLTNATVQFHMRDSAGELVIDETATVDPDQTANTGLVTYTWQTGDTDTAGDYEAEFEAVFSGKPITFPKGSNLRVRIVGDIA